MTDCMPTTSGRSELSEKEKQVLGGFWVYVQPMSLYRQIQRHQEYQAVFLRRNLTYHKPKSPADAARCTELSLHLSLEGRKDIEKRTGSVFVIACKKLTSAPGNGRKCAIAFQPLSVQLVKLDQTPANTQGSAVTVKVPYQEQHQLAQLGVMLLTVGDPAVEHMLCALKKRTKRSMAGAASVFGLTSGCTAGKAFGLIPSGEAVFWHFTNLPESLDAQSPLKLKVWLRKGIMRTVAGSAGYVVQLTSQAVQGPSFAVQLSLPPSETSRPASAPSSSSGSNGMGQAGSNGSHCAISIPARSSQEEGKASSTVHFCYYFQNGLRHVKEATTNFTCFACKQACKGLVGLQQHMEASHDLFDFSYSLGGVDLVPSVNVRCPAELYDQQGNLQNPEAADVADFNVTDCKELYFECHSKKMRKLRLQQYGMTDKERGGLPACLLHNQFSKAAWKSWHAVVYEDNQQHMAKAATSPVFQEQVPRPLPPTSQVRPHPITKVWVTSHAEASTSMRVNHDVSGMSIGDGATYGGGVAAASAKTGKLAVAAQRQDHPKGRKRSRPPNHALRSIPHPAPVYFHARSCSRMTPREAAQVQQDPNAIPDSDDEEEDRERSKVRAVRQLDKQKGFSAAEKSLMLSWNLYLHDHPCLSDTQMSQRCVDFAAEQAKDLKADPDLRRCFMAHLVNLWEFNIIKPDVVDACTASIEANL